MSKLSDLLTKITKTQKDNDDRDLKNLSDRLQQRAFSWQHKDYFLLKRVLPDIAILSSANAELLRTLKPFIEAGHCVDWEHTKDHLYFYPVNSLKAEGFIKMGDLRQAVEVYEKFKSGGGEK